MNKMPAQLSAATIVARLSTIHVPVSGSSLHTGELKCVADRWRMDYNHCCWHSSLEHISPVALAARCIESGCAWPNARSTR
jgi:hypothetical protein